MIEGGGKRADLLKKKRSDLFKEIGSLSHEGYPILL